MTYNGYNPNGYKVDNWEDLVDAGWKQIMRNLQKEAPQDVKLTQVKEKFGELRIYYEGGDDAFYRRVAEATDLSSKTCEICGKPGSIRKVKYILKCVCEEHYNESRHDR